MDFEKASVFSGIMESHRQPEHKYPVVEYDINGAYIHAATSSKLPVRLRRVWERPSIVRVEKEIEQGNCVIAKVHIKTRENQYPWRHKGHTYYASGRFITYLTTHELQQAIEHREAICIERAHIYDADYIFGVELQHAYYTAQELQQPMRSIAKTMILAALGMLASRGGVSCTIPAPYFHDKLVQAYNFIDPHTPVHTTTAGNWRIVYRKTGTGHCVAPHIYAHITAYTRLAMRRLKQRIGETNCLWIYIDCITVPDTNTVHNVIGETSQELGMLKCAARANSAAFWAPWVVCYDDQYRIKPTDSPFRILGCTATHVVIEVTGRVAPVLDVPVRIRRVSYRKTIVLVPRSLHVEVNPDRPAPEPPLDPYARLP